MKSEPQYYHRLTIYMISMCLMIFASFQLCKGSSKEEGNERTVLRRRRHLIFPEGSSLQIGKIDEILCCNVTVYDTYHPVVDYTNLLVVGITGALAWELPSKPVYLEEELQEIYNNGSLPLLRRKDGNVEINTFQDKNVAVNREMQPINSKKLPTYNGSSKFQHYLSYANIPFEKTNILNQLNRENFRSKKIFFPRFKTHHSIHPTSRKRSASEKNVSTPEEIFNLQLHKTSRYLLYKSLEKFIDTTGHEGRQCILKALCETGQTKQNGKRRSFLGEIMTAVFSLPDVQLIEQNLTEELYDVVHIESANCTERYSRCSQRIWKSSFH